MVLTDAIKWTPDKTNQQVAVCLWVTLFLAAMNSASFGHHNKWFAPHVNVLLLALRQLETLIRVSMKEPPDLHGVRRCFLALSLVPGTTSLFSRQSIP